MNNPTNAFFFEIQQISEDSPLFDEFKNQQIFFSYFLVDQKYYLFFYGQKSIDIDLIDPFIDIIEELDTKERKIRSLRGFFLYVLEIMENGKDLQILRTNLKPSFWRNLKTILRQNKKAVLLEFLFGSQKISLTNDADSEKRVKALENQVQILQNQVNSLQDRISDLENELRDNSKYALSTTIKVPDATKTIEQGDSNLKVQKDDSRTGNLSQVNSEVDQLEKMDSNQKKENFITLGKISEAEKIEIIKLGFQLQAKGKISLKKYYESTDPNSLFQFKGYSVKYESIRRTTLYQKLKP